VADRAALIEMLRELMKVVRLMRTYIPDETLKAPAPTLLPRGKQDALQLPRAVGAAERACVRCKNYMADTVTLPCMHCVLCQLCWNQYYASGENSTFVRVGSKCPVPSCNKVIKLGVALGTVKSQGNENSVRYHQRNEYLAGSAALV
jgi:hypothetical protein